MTATVRVLFVQWGMAGTARLAGASRAAGAAGRGSRLSFFAAAGGADAPLFVCVRVRLCVRSCRGARRTLALRNQTTSAHAGFSRLLRPRHPRRVFGRACAYCAIEAACHGCEAWQLGTARLLPPGRGGATRVAAP